MQSQPDMICCCKHSIAEITVCHKRTCRDINPTFLDQDYMMRTPGEIGELIRDNRCGAFFGWWWAPNNPLIEAVEANPGAEWKPYVIADEYGFFLPPCFSRFT